MPPVQSIEIRSGDGKEWHGSSNPHGLQPESDTKDMYRMGKGQEFRRNFKTVSISSFSLACMMGFIFIPINFPIIFAVAGTGGAFVMYIANFFGFLTVVLSLAEMSSIAPTAGGQYHWVSEFAPPTWQRFLSYVSGWLSAMSWLVGVASGMFLIGSLTPALAELTYPSYHPTAWHAYLLTVAYVTIICTVNGFLAKHLPLLEGFIIVFMSLAFLSLIIVLSVLSPKLTASEVFQSFGSEVDSQKALEMVASQAFIFFALLGSDSTAHMAEETQQANRVIPNAMVGSYVVMAFSTNTGYSFLQSFITSTGSAGGAIALTAMLMVLIMLSATNFMASTSRQVWAFARDKGLPFHSWIAKVNPRTESPINSLIVVYVFVILIALIGLGSSVAFNAIVSLQGLALAGTYEVSILCLIWRRVRGRRLPAHPWDLGGYGLAMNVMAAIYGMYLFIYCAMPGVYPVTGENMNYAPVIFGGIMLASQIYYVVWARNIYEGPVVYVRDE